MIAHRLRDAGVAAVARKRVEPVPAADRELLLIRPDHLGDVLFLTPGLRRLRRAVPSARITLAVGPWSRAALEGNSDVDEVIAFAYPGFTRADRSGPFAPYRALIDFARTVRARRPAAAVVLRDDHWWAALAVQRAGVPVRVGADHPAVRQMLSHPIPVEGHWVVRNAALLDGAAGLLGGSPPEDPVAPATDPLRWDVDPAARAGAQAILRANRIDGPYVVVAPGAGAAVKLWPTERWAAVASAIGRERSVAVVLVGSAAEAALTERLRSAMTIPAIDLAGTTDLATLGAVLAGAVLTLGVDSGPLHLATAVGTPTVRLYGPSSVERYGPWGDPLRHRVVTAGMACPRCGDLSPSRSEGAGCMVAIEVDAVLAAVGEVLRDA